MLKPACLVHTAAGSVSAYRVADDDAVSGKRAASGSSQDCVAWSGGHGGGTRGEAGDRFRLDAAAF